VYHEYDVNDIDRRDSLVCAIAVDGIVKTLGWRERKALAGMYLCQLVHWRMSSLISARRVISKGLKLRGLID
jgi:hypothetical protein